MAKKLLEIFSMGRTGTFIMKHRREEKKEKRETDTKRFDVGKIPWSHPTSRLQKPSG